MGIVHFAGFAYRSLEGGPSGYECEQPRAIRHRVFCTFMSRREKSNALVANIKSIERFTAAFKRDMTEGVLWVAIFHWISIVSHCPFPKRFSKKLRKDNPMASIKNTDIA
jgi:hypothetical protein